MASKLFEYALCRRAIVASRISGAEKILGPEAFYFEPERYDGSLREALERTEATPRAELRRRGMRVSERVATEFNWERQASRMAEFIATN